MNQERFEEIVTTIVGWFNEACSEAKLSFKNCPEDKLIRYHHSIGQDIRNEFKLWSVKWEPKIVEGFDMSEDHPDAISQKIIVEVWRRVQ